MHFSFLQGDVTANVSRHIGLYPSALTTKMCVTMYCNRKLSRIFVFHCNMVLSIAHSVPFAFGYSRTIFMIQHKNVRSTYAYASVLVFVLLSM